MSRAEIVLAVVAAFVVFGCSPDLVVTTFETTGAPTVNVEGSAQVPVRVVVRNQGNASAGTFKVATEYTGSAGTFVVSFSVPGQSSVWYPFTAAPLAAGQDVTFLGNVIFHPSVHGETVSLVAIADSCSGDEFTPAYCRVNESNEGNNESAALTGIALP